jgi:hypothetical protein
MGHKTVIFKKWVPRGIQQKNLQNLDMMLTEPDVAAESVLSYQQLTLCLG